jgi:DNA-binding IclR family transcriptional regulator
VGLQRTTAHRYLSSMANAGLLERDDEGAYRLGSLLVQLGTVALNGLRVLEVAGPRCQALANEAHETVVIAGWGGLGPVVAQEYEASDRLVNISIRVGRPLPLDAAQSLVYMAFSQDASLPGRLLASLSDAHRRQVMEQIEAVRRDGFAINSQVVQGIRAIAMPVFNGHGDVCATVAMIGTVTGIPDDPGAGVLLAIARTAQMLSHDLGWTGDLPFEALVDMSQSAS